MPVEPVADAVRDCEQVAEGLVARDRRGRHDERVPRAAEHRSRKIDRPPDRSDLRRRVEGRADLVVRNRRLELGQGLERPAADASSIQSGLLRPGNAGDADAAISCKPASRSAVGISRKRTVGRPAKVSTSMTEVEPVKSSP